MTDHEKIIDRVQKLKRHAESAEAIGNEAEAQAFAAMYQRIMNEHMIDMTDIEFEAFEKEEPVEKHRIDYGAYPDIKIRKGRIEWIERLAGVVARAHWCRILTRPGSSMITLVGRKSDVAVAEYMLITLQRAAEKITKDAHSKFCWEVYKRDGNCQAARGFKESFIRAFIVRLAQRYEEAKNQQANSNTALVRFNRSFEAVNAFVEGKDDNGKKKFPTSGRLSTTVAWNREGIKRGTRAADDINLEGRAIANTCGSKRRELES